MFSRSYIQNHYNHPHYISDSKLTLLQNKTVLNNSEYDAAQTLRSVSDPTKMRILLLLREVEEIAVSDIATALKITPSATSHALSDLKKLDLVKSHRCGQLTCYSLVSDSKKQEFIALINKFL